MSQQIQELEEQEVKAVGRYQEAADELEHLRRNYGIADGESRTSASCASRQSRSIWL